jgi:nicotinate-nucleotide adenylyltransferase
MSFKILSPSPKGLLMVAAVFGGTFDPVHNGHIEIIKNAQIELPIEHMFIVPVYRNPFKNSNIATDYKRVEWLRKSLENIKDITILDFEIKQHKPSYTIDTIKYILDSFNITKLYLIIGADNIDTLSSWKDYTELVLLVEVVVITRDGIKIDDFKTINIDMNISATEIRDGKKLEFISQDIRDDVLKIYK